MTHTTDRELQQWMEMWKTTADTADRSPEAIHRYVRQRSRLLRIWLAAEWAVVVAIAPLLIRTAIVGDAVERVAMGLLAAIAAGALVFSWWNWRGVAYASAESIAACLLLSQLRVHRLRRAVGAGWFVLAAEVLVFVPWIAYRLHGGVQPAPPSSVVFGWTLLTAMTFLGAGCLAALSQWARNEAARLDSLRQELDNLRA
jgi:hypothetical protein